MNLKMAANIEDIEYPNEEGDEIVTKRSKTSNANAKRKTSEPTVSADAGNTGTYRIRLSRLIAGQRRWYASTGYANEESAWAEAGLYRHAVEVDRAEHWVPMHQRMADVADNVDYQENFEGKSCETFRLNAAQSSELKLIQSAQRSNNEECIMYEREYIESVDRSKFNDEYLERLKRNFVRPRRLGPGPDEDEKKRLRYVEDRTKSNDEKLLEYEAILQRLQKINKEDNYAHLIIRDDEDAPLMSDTATDFSSKQMMRVKEHFRAVYLLLKDKLVLENALLRDHLDIFFYGGRNKVTIDTLKEQVNALRQNWKMPSIISEGTENKFAMISHQPNNLKSFFRPPVYAILNTEKIIRGIGTTRHFLSK